MIIQFKSRVRILCKEDDNSRAQAAFYATQKTNYNTQFAEQQNIQNSLLAKMQPIVAAGPGQYGYDATEDTALRASATDTDAKAFSDQSVKLDNQFTAQNGGVSGATPTGARDQLKQQLAVDAAKKNCSDQQGITLAGYNQGSSNYKDAVSGEEGIMGQNNSSTAANAVSTAGQASTSATTEANNAGNAWMTLAGAAIGGGASVLSAGLKK